MKMKIKDMIPVKSGEFTKFLLTSFMMVLTLYIYSILRNAKDALIISEVGPELISTIKLYGVLPSAILLILVYTKLTDYFNRVTVYHTLIWFFVLFFLAFNYIFYPNTSSIHFDFTNAIENYPFAKYPLIMIANWSYSLFYIMSELWGSMMISLMFWQLANQINTVDEAKRFYSLFGFFGQIGLIAAGLLAGVFNNPEVTTDWSVSLNYIILSILAAGITLSFILYYLGNHVIGNDVINGTSTKKRKEKMGLINSLKLVFSSKYIGLITLLVLCYGISINLVEGVWKKQVGVYFELSASKIGAFTSDVQVWTGIATFLAMLASSYIVRMFSWRIAAILTPVIILLTGIPFFGFVVYQDFFANEFTINPENIIFLAVMFGAAQNILSKAIKYSFFDPTKEMAYIPLDEELKSKGKSAADVIGGRLGKSGGAIIQWLFLTFVAGSTLTSIAPSLFVIFVIILIIWIFAVFSLSKEFIKLNNQVRIIEESKTNSL